MKTALTTALAATSLLAIATSSLAQTTATPSAIAGGPPITGLCVLSSERAVETSAVGLTVLNRMKQLKQAVDAELQPDAAALQQEQQAIQAQRASLTQDQFAQKANAWGAKYEALQRKAQLREQELQATQQVQMRKINDQLEPIVRQIYGQRACSLLINADVTFGNFYNQGMDITPTVITALNGKITSLSFDREHLDQQGGQGVAAATQPTSVAPAAPRKKK
ncbi:MAG TPA: OmpH family outer membrane protein [Caulobacteraceae bacterium]|jgi:outer membrane protein